MNNPMSAVDQVTNLLNEPAEAPIQETENNVTALDQHENEAEPVIDEEALPSGNEPEDEGETLQTITELAQYLDVPSEEMYDIQIPLSDGYDPITISEMKDQYVENLRTRQQFEEEQKVFRDAQTQHQQEIAKMQAHASSGAASVNKKVIEAEGLIQAISAQFESIDWEQAKVQDAGKAAMYRQELNEAYQKANQARDNAVNEARQESQKGYQEYATREWQETLKVIPEWKVKGSMETDRTAMQATAESYGISQQELFQTVDHRLLHLLRDYTNLKNANSKADATAKRVVKKGVTFKKQGVRLRAPVKKKALQEKMDRAKKSHDMRDVTGAVTDLLNL